MIKNTHDWFVAAGQMPANPTPDVRQAAFYVGMQLEEMSEKLAVIFGAAHETPVHLHVEGNKFKAGTYDAWVAKALAEHAKDLLDADMDQIWVSIGAAYAQGAMGALAYGEVAGRNWAKKFDDGTFHRDAVTGKVLKPEGWTAPDLTPFVHETLRKPAPVAAEAAIA